jgi:hypothetical protein
MRPDVAAEPVVGNRPGALPTMALLTETVLEFRVSLIYHDRGVRPNIDE